MLQVILGVIRCISDFQQPCVSKTAILRAKHTPKSLCYPVLCGHYMSVILSHRAPNTWAFCFRGEVMNGGFGLVLDGTEVALFTYGTFLNLQILI